VPDNAFDKMSDKLKEIHLQRNVILDMGPMAFRGLPALELVDLSENQLNEIPSAGFYFDAAPRLVDVSKNKIVSIDSEAFVDPGNNGMKINLALFFPQTILLLTHSHVRDIGS
jgi:Leucine-rich repeat (LRR) protein